VIKKKKKNEFLENPPEPGGGLGSTHLPLLPVLGKKKMKRSVVEVSSSAKVKKREEYRDCGPENFWSGIGDPRKSVSSVMPVLKKN